MSELFARTHELKHLSDIDGGWIAECWCGREFWSSFAVIASLKHAGHSRKALKRAR